ncbi:MAG: cytochrome c3 family protein, partial [Gemmatimonadota bacterium]
MSPRTMVRAAFAGLGVIVVLGLAAPSDANAQVEPKHHNCWNCHDLHGGGYAALTAYATSEDLCLSCHSEAGPAEIDLDGVLTPVPRQTGIHNGSKHSTPTSCWNCHDHEGEARSDLGADNFDLIPKIRTTPNTGDMAVEFTAYSGTNSFADGDATYDGVCEVCHTLTSEHRYDGSVGGHNAGADCRQCHDHDGGFQGAGGGCTGCHSSSQGSRRPIVPEFDRKSHHVDWSINFATADSIPDSDCETCHDQSQHQQGTVRLKNADDATVTAYTGVPGQLEVFCAACHDSDGAGLAAGGIPFSDGLPPPDVATTWSASSHEGMG